MMIPFTTAIQAEIHSQEAEKNARVYRIKRPTIKQLQASGLADTVIEHVLGITIRPEDRIA